jgi:hypothetical protein
MRLAPLLPALVALAAAGPARLQAADGEGVPLVLSLEDQANGIWSALPTTPDDARVTLAGDTSRECAEAALREARRLLEAGAGGRGTLRQVTLPLRVPKESAAQLLGGQGALSVLAPQLTPTTRSALVMQPLEGDKCDDAGAFYDLRVPPGQPARLMLQMVLEGGCGCSSGLAGPASETRFHILAQAELEPGVAEGRQGLRLRARPARYAVLASCSACGSLPALRAVEAAGASPCDGLCAPLARGLAAWQGKATAAADRLADLAGKATTLQLQMTSDRQELTAAESRRSKPRAVLERISALQAKIKAAQVELDRIANASRNLQAAVSAFQRATGETQSAGQECQSQCRAREQRAQRAQRENPPTQPSTAKPGGGSKTVLVAGGVLLAGGGAALALGGGSDSPAERPDTPPGGGTGGGSGGDFAGNWSGTRSVTSRENGTICSRSFSETWSITQNGREVRAAISSQASCAPSANCPCDTAPLPRQHNGTVEGNIARFFVFPEVASCVLPLTLSGDTLFGAMPSCTANPGLQAHEVVLRRVR